MINQENILYQDEDIIIINKPAGLPVHYNDFMPRDALWLTKLAGKLIDHPVFNVHRLDAKTSGVIVLALSREIAGLLTQQFSDQQVDKTYIALTKGNPGKGTFKNPVLVKKKSKKRKAAITHYSTLESNYTGLKTKEGNPLIISRVELKPETGRWHQLRQHLAQNRTDIIGDSQHGDFTLNRLLAEITDINRLMLHASKIRFLHPLKKIPLHFSAPVPEDFNLIMNKMQKHIQVNPCSRVFNNTN